ncbi:hypothetical protein [Alkalihalophilus marmarensis]|nr:hypothetical protein [Alkalihalophilus marmarensis]
MRELAEEAMNPQLGEEDRQHLNERFIKLESLLVELQREASRANVH